jgi:hypothetical protein
MCFGRYEESIKEQLRNTQENSNQIKRFQLNRLTSCDKELAKKERRGDGILRQTSRERLSQEIVTTDEAEHTRRTS